MPMLLALRQRIPDIILESIFIVFALLLALAIEGWNENREKQERAQNARHSIAEELRGNLAKLEQRMIVHQDLLDEIVAHIDEIGSESETNERVLDSSFSVSIAFLSIAAWESAQVSGTLEWFSINELTRYSEVFQLHDLFVANQNRIIDDMILMVSVKDENYVAFISGLATRLEMLIEVNKLLSREIESILESSPTR